MFNSKLLAVALCLSSPIFANGWLASPLRLEADTKSDQVQAVAHYEATKPDPEFFPVFDLNNEGIQITASEKNPQVNTETGLYAQTYEIKFPLGVVSGERRIALPYRLGGKGEAEDFILIVKIPELTLLSDRMVVWGRNAPADAQKVTVALISPEGYELTEAVTVRGDATAKIQRDAAHKYTIIVTPGNTAVPGRSVINVKAVGHTGQDTSFIVYAEIM